MASVAGPNTTEPIIAILKANGIDPDSVCGNGQTAFDVLEGYIAGAIEAIENDDFDDDDFDLFDDDDDEDY